MNKLPNYSVVSLTYLTSRWRSIFIWSTCMFLLALMFTALHETFAGEIDSMAKNAPAAMEAVWGGNLEFASTPEGWLGLELYGLILPIVLCIIGVAAGASMIGSEEDSGTLELLLASPIGRTSLISQKFAAASLQIFIVAIIVWVGISIGTFIFNFDVSLPNVFSATIMAFLIGLITCSVTLLVQSLTGNKSLAISAGAIFIAASYVADILSKLIDSLTWLKWLSSFHYYSGSEVLLNGVHFPYFFGMLIACTVILLLAIKGFKQRDTGT